MSRLVRFAPLALLLVILAALIWRLATPADTTVSSKLQNRPVPQFDAPAAIRSKAGVSSATLAAGEPRLVNFFGSWCIPCITEVKVLQDLQSRGVAIDGVAVRDQTDAIADFLDRYGDPYARIGDDPRSAIQIAFGSSGVPESFIVDGRGIVRYQHIGPIEQSDIPMILKQLQQAR